MTVWIKQGVVGELQTIARKGLGAVADLIHSHGHDIFITSIREGNHMAGSLHYDGYAFDFIHHSQVTIEEIKEVLGPSWDVVSDVTHIHCEYDPK